MDNRKYRDYMDLEHNEIPAAINQETGEIRTRKKRKSNIPVGNEVFEPKASFRKDYTNSWSFLKRVLTPLEFKAAFTLALLARASSNSLEPINDSTSYQSLSETTGVSINKIKPVLKKLYDLGVYGGFDVAEVGKQYTKYWIFNPYLSFQGQIVRSDIAQLFRNTHCAKAFYDPEYNPIL